MLAKQIKEIEKESTNIIEIHTQQWYGGECQGWNVTQGIENADGTVAYAVPGRNYNEIWQVLPGDDDFVSFTPGDSFEYLVQEADNDYNLIFNLPEDITVYEDTLETKSHSIYWRLSPPAENR